MDLYIKLNYLIIDFFFPLISTLLFIDCTSPISAYVITWNYLCFYKFACHLFPMVQFERAGVISICILSGSSAFRSYYSSLRKLKLDIIVVRT